jgi:hypothetical protein
VSQHKLEPIFPHLKPILVIVLIASVVGSVIYVVSTSNFSGVNIDFGAINLNLPTPSPTPAMQTGHFTGTLAAITYDQDASYHTISATHIIFADGNSFQLEGNRNYAIGLKYTVTYQYYTNSENGDTVVTSTDNVELVP